MKIAIIGASGKAGSLVAKEAAARGHEVTAIVRSAAKAAAAGLNGFAVLEKDIFDLNAQDLGAFDVVVNAFGASPGQERQHVDAGRSLIGALQGAPGTRMIVIGGAGSLYVDEAKTVRLVDTPEFPEMYKATALAAADHLEDLRAASGIRWTFMSPAAFFDAAGKRTGTYRAGTDWLLVNAKGDSYLSYEDGALALVDEIERPQHENARFTVVSEAD
ncbi:NAD(P)-dependent oxidoreductase [Paenibacillus sacheonensis]|uniref:NAD(P)H-binding protein n=1 Tax=Paenibacillus sacheonensis TaxID=742054 RepID=A0A7X4YVK2_9BACL|nr:NAD(P)-dependent oxidoreductase [Paenibacillus sacheonensis]MBM7568561.1 putative NADH-flavin reductase [Paenibacillus sacheonensis]NBC72384.1 NAD(P)H-binding protein [Paenibacillus sacheonensis]